MLSVVIPTYNERTSVEELLQRLAAVRPRLSEALEVVMVDDRSADATADVAEALLSREALGRVIRRTGRRDLAQAVVEGIRHARGDLIAVMDADLSHPPELLPALVEAVRSGCELAIASRYVSGGGIANWPWSRRTLSRIANLLTRSLVPVADATSGYFVGEAHRLKAILLHPAPWKPRLSRRAPFQRVGTGRGESGAYPEATAVKPWGGVQPRGFKILLEILVRGCVHRAQEVPYLFRDRAHGSSKLGRRVLWLYAAQLGRLHLYRMSHPCPHRRSDDTMPRAKHDVCVEALLKEARGAPRA
jgi:dolichol-phosphate mannosyltransferase